MDCVRGIITPCAQPQACKRISAGRGLVFFASGTKMLTELQRSEIYRGQNSHTAPTITRILSDVAFTSPSSKGERAHPKNRQAPLRPSISISKEPALILRAILSRISPEERRRRAAFRRLSFFSHRRPCLVPLFCIPPPHNKASPSVAAAEQASISQGCYTRLHVAHPVHHDLSNPRRRNPHGFL